MRAFQCLRRSLGQGKKEHDPCRSRSACLMLEEFRFEECSFCPIEIFIDLYKNTTFDLKSPLASLYKHGKCYWALEISFNEGKVFLLKSIIFFSFNTTSSEEPGKLNWSGLWENGTNPCLAEHRGVVEQTVDRERERMAVARKAKVQNRQKWKYC